MTLTQEEQQLAQRLSRMTDAQIAFMAEAQVHEDMVKFTMKNRHLTRDEALEFMEKPASTDKLFLPKMSDEQLYWEMYPWTNASGAEGIQWHNYTDPRV